MKLFDIIIVFSIMFATGAAAAGAGKAPPSGDGKLSLYNYHENEYLDITYRQGQRLLPDGVKRIQHLLRSRSDGTERPIDLRLIELIDHLQDHFGAETIEIISGYRSPAYNRSLKLEGRGVASESLHTLGLAADIHIDEVSERELFEYAQGLGVGGAGIYPRFNFVHVDVGPARTWQEAVGRERVLIGTENNPNPAWSTVTDNNSYRPGATLTAAVTNNDYRDQRLIVNVWTERFRKGQWQEEKKITERPRSVRVDSGASTPYSWEIPPDTPRGRYRLVIFTSKDFSIPPSYSNEFYIRDR